MPWTRDNHISAHNDLRRYVNELDSSINAWKASVQATANADEILARKNSVNQTLNNLRTLVNSLRARSEELTANGTAIDDIARLAAEVAEEKEKLRRLKEKRGTRVEQAHSVNPKITSSPFVNALWLRRNFRENTRIGLIIASAVFGIVAFGAMGFLVYSMVTNGAMKPSLYAAPQTGGRRRLRLAEDD